MPGLNTYGLVAYSNPEPDGPPMTDDRMNLRALVVRMPDAELLRGMIGFAAERLMEMEVGAATGAAYGGKDPGRKAQRNG